MERLTKTHAIRSYIQRICLGRVDKRDWTTAGRVDDAKEVDSHGDASNASRVLRLLGYPEGEPGEEKTQRHERETHQQQVAPTKGVDRVHCRQRKQEIDDAEPERGGQGGHVRVVGLLEDVRRIVRDHVDTAELYAISIQCEAGFCGKGWG